MRHADSFTFECITCGGRFDIHVDDRLLVSAGSTQALIERALRDGSFDFHQPPFTSYLPAAMRSIFGVPEPQCVPEPTTPGPELRSFDGSFVGYRAWQIKGWALTGTASGQGYSWVPGENKAACVGGWNRDSHRAPAPDCHCGFNALARFKDDASWWDGSNGSFEIVGAIEAWADPREDNNDGFFIHSTGFRAEYARIILLATADEYPRAKNGAIRALAAEHGADVCRRDHLEDAAKEHGQLVPDELLEWARDEQLHPYAHPHPSIIRGPMTVYAAPISTRTPKPAQPPPKPKGIAWSVGHPGPPHGKAKHGTRVRDSKRVVWRCVRSGNPGAWVQE